MSTINDANNELHALTKAVQQSNNSNGSSPKQINGHSSGASSCSEASPPHTDAIDVPISNLMQQLQQQMSPAEQDQHSPLLYTNESSIHNDHFNNNNIHNNNNNHVYDNHTNCDENVNSNNNDLKFMQKYLRTHVHHHQTQQQMQQQQQISSPTCQQQQQHQQEMLQHQIQQHHLQQHQIQQAHQPQQQTMTQQLMHLIPSSSTPEPSSPMRITMQTPITTTTTTSNEFLGTATSVITTTSQAAMNQINQLHQIGQQQVIHLPNHNNNINTKQQQHISAPSSPYSTLGMEELIDEHDVKTEFNFDMGHNPHSSIENSAFDQQQRQQQQHQHDLDSETHEQVFRLHAAAQQRLYDFERKFDRQIIVKME